MCQVVVSVMKKKQCEGNEEAGECVYRGCSILCRLDEEAPSSEESGDTTWDMWKRLPGGWEECPWHWLPTALSQGTTGKP